MKKKTMLILFCFILFPSCNQDNARKCAINSNVVDSVLMNTLYKYKDKISKKHKVNRIILKIHNKTDSSIDFTLGYILNEFDYSLKQGTDKYFYADGNFVILLCDPQVQYIEGVDIHQIDSVIIKNEIFPLNGTWTYNVTQWVAKFHNGRLEITETTNPLPESKSVFYPR